MFGLLIAGFCLLIVVVGGFFGWLLVWCFVVCFCEVLSLRFFMICTLLPGMVFDCFRVGVVLGFGGGFGWVVF